MTKQIVIQSEDAEKLALAVQLLQNLEDIQVKSIQDLKDEPTKEEMKEGLFKLSSDVFSKYLKD